MADLLLCPRGGESELDPLNPITARWTPFSAVTTPGTTANFQFRPDSNPEGTASSTFVDPDYLVSNDFTQAQMARADVAWKSNLLEGAEILGGATPDEAKRVLAVVFQVSAHGTWPDSPGYPGDAKVRVVCAIDGVRVRTVEVLNAAEYAGGGAAQAWSDECSIFDALTEVLGDGFTVGDLLELATDGKLTFQVVAWQGGDAFVDEWYCGGVVVTVTHVDTEPGTQTHWQLRVASDGLMADIVYDTGQVYDETRRRRRHTVPPEALAPEDGAPCDRYWQIRLFEDGVGRAWSPAVHTRFMSVGAARLLHGFDSPPLFLAEIEALHWIGGHRFRRHVTGSAFLYDATLSRSALGVANVFLRDLEIDGVRQYVTLRSNRSDTESNANSVYWDELATVIAGDGSMGLPVANTLYVHLTGHVAPSGNRAAGVGVVLVIPISSGPEVWSGPRNETIFWPVLVGAPGTTDRLFDFREGRRQTPTGGLTFRNMNVDEDSPSTPWYRAFQLVRPDGPCKLLIQKRPYQLLLTRAGLPYAHALALTSGTVEFPSSSFLTREEVSLQTNGIEWDGDKQKLVTARFTAAEYPHLKDGVDGQLKGKMWGAGHKGVLAQLVDQGEAGVRKPQLYTRENCSAVPSLYQDGTAVDTGALAPWTFDPTTKLIEFDTTDAAKIDTIRAAAWTMDADGEELVPWDGGPATATTLAGALFKQWIVRVGRIPDNDTIDYLDSLESFPVRFDCLDESLTTLEALRTLEETRGVYMLPLGDRRVTLVERDPTELDAYSAVLGQADLTEAEPVWNPDTSRVGIQPVIEYQGYPSPGTAVAQVSNRDDEVAPQFGAGNDTTIPTYHATEAGARARLASIRSGSPDVRAELPCTLRAWPIRPGSTIVLDLPNVLDETGQALAWRLLQVLERKREGERVTLSVRRLDKTLPREARPGW